MNVCVKLKCVHVWSMLSLSNFHDEAFYVSVCNTVHARLSYVAKLCLITNELIITIGCKQDWD